MTLTHTDPATVFISYAREDEKDIELLEHALRLRGVRVLRDKPSLPLGAHTVSTLSAMIDQECDAVLFYVTDAFLRSDFIWRYEMPITQERHRRETRFHLIPVLKGVSYGSLTGACAAHGLTSLAEFNAAKVAGDAPSIAELNAIGRRSLRSAFALRLARAYTEEPAAPSALSLRSFAFSPPASTLHLDMDWLVCRPRRIPSRLPDHLPRRGGRGYSPP